ncbi:MAG TPA: flagellar motor protein PomA, partial [Parvularcula sp.]|nr:flagellar motor protein PomA [Parvularcula sp.]HBS33121.1 flagellar motor protein PomA [Parvularcula sp.]HBS33501.1 flagellar motor protein PomA [Parvularcula sp.]
MDFATVGGIAAGIFVVGLAIVLSGSVAVFLNMPSILIVVGGAAAATVLRFPVDVVAQALVTGARFAFLDHAKNPGALLNEIRTLAQIIRRQGPMALERAPVSEPFLARGKQMIADGFPVDQLRAQLTRERDLEIQRLVDGERIFRAIGEAAPAFGMIGTVVGLVQMLSMMEDPSTIGPAMAVALLTTLYGALIAYVIALPIADKLASKLETQETALSLIIDGLVQVAERRSPAAITDMLIVYLPEKARGAFAPATA